MTDLTARGPDVRTVLELDDQRYSAMVEADVDVLDAILDDRLLYTHSNGELDTKGSYLAAVRDREFDYSEITHDTTHVLEQPEAIILAGTMHATVTIRGTEKSLANAFLGVWLRSELGWRQAAYQTTPLPH